MHEQAGTDSGGFSSTQPGTDDRITALKSTR